MAGMPLDRILLRGLGFHADGSMVLEYCIPAEDARRNGVVLNHTLLVPAGQDYDDEMTAVHDAVLALIDDVLEDLPNLEPARIGPRYDTDTDDDDDEDEDEDDEDDELLD